MKTALLVAVLWIASLAVVWFVRSPQGLGPSAEGPKIIEKVRSQSPGLQPTLVESEGKANRSASSRNGELRVIGEGGAGPQTLEISSSDMRRSLEQALNSDDVVGRNLMLAELIANLNPDNVDAALAVFSNADNSWHGDQAYRLFMYRWAEIDGRSAAEHAFYNPEARRVGFFDVTAMAGWSKTDPAAAKEFYDAAEGDNDKQRSMTWGLVMGWAESDLDQATKFVVDELDGETRRRSIDTIARQHITQRGAQSALRYASEFAVATASDDEGLAKSMMKEFGERPAREDPVGAADWVDGNLEHPFLSVDVLEEVADELTEEDPQQGVAWVEKHLAEGRLNSKIVGEFLDEYAQADPTAAAAWADGQLAEGSEMVENGSLGRIASRWGEKDPAAAVDWALSFDDAEQKQATLAPATSQWARKDPEAVAEFLSDNKGDTDLDGARAAYAGTIAREQPEVAMEMAATIEDEDMRNRSMVAAGRSMFRKNPEAVQAWLPVSGLDEAAQRQVTEPDRGRGGWGRGGDRGRGGR